MLDISDAFAYSQSTNMFMAFGVCSGGGDIELIQNEEVYISRNGFEVIPELSQAKPKTKTNIVDWYNGNLLLEERKRVEI